MAAMTKKEQYLRIWDEYRKAHGNDPGSTLAMIEWAKENGLYAVDQTAALRKGAAELAEVLRDITIADGDGDDVRVNIPFLDETEGWLWDDMRTIRHDRMEIGAAHGRNRIVGEVKSMAKQLRFYQSYHPSRPQIQVSFNFENDLLDAGIPLPTAAGTEPFAGVTSADR
jgi:hypothetical protein